MMIKVSIVALMLIFGSCLGEGARRCKLTNARLVMWEKLTGIWYNTFSHAEDETQLDGRCNSMVVAGSFGYEGVAVVRNVMPQKVLPDGMNDVAPKGVSEYFIPVDPGIFKLDQASELQWINTNTLEKIMSREKMTSFVNAISDHYTGVFAVTTDYKNYLMISQCNRQGNFSVWVYTKTPNPADEVKKIIDRHMTQRRIEVELQRNDACVATINSIFEQSAEPK